MLKQTVANGQIAKRTYNALKRAPHQDQPLRRPWYRDTLWNEA